jgi:hypothetical protein
MPKTDKQPATFLKPREQKKPYPAKPGPKPKHLASGSAPTLPSFTSAGTKAADRKRMTVGDWLMVFAWWDTHPHATQMEVVEEFASRRVGALHFKQNTLSDAKKRRESMETLAEENSVNLSRSRARVVVCPEVDRALVLWTKHMEEKGELVTQAMLGIKRKWFENEMKISEERRLGANGGWIQSFCKMCVII